MTVIDADVGGRGGGENLPLILEARIGLNHSDRVVTGGVRLQVRVPKQPITSTSPNSQPAAALEGPGNRAQHNVSLSDCGFLGLGLF